MSTGVAGVDSILVKNNGLVKAIPGNSFSGGSSNSEGHTYTPTLTNASNISSSSVASATYIKSDSIVVVNLRLTVDITTSGSFTTIRFSLPYSAHLFHNASAHGVATENSHVNDELVFYSNSTGSTGDVSFIPGAASGTTYNLNISYSYKIN